MLFKSPFKPKAQINLQAPNSGRPGANLPAEIRLLPLEEIHPREIRLELTGIETYYRTETTHGPKGQVQTRIVKREESFTKEVQSIIQQPVLITGAEQSWKTSMIVPPDAAPTARGKLVNIQWGLKTVVDVTMRADQSAELPFRVFRIPPQTGNSINTLPVVTTYDDCTLSLEAPGIAAAGETLIGHLRLETKCSLQVRGIRVELKRVEDAGARKSDEILMNQELSGAVSFSPYEAKSFDLALAIPADAPPTAISPHSSLRWKIKVSLDRRLRKDFNIEQEVLVYNAPEAKAQAGLI
jgi:hypothetical protein